MNAGRSLFERMAEVARLADMPDSDIDTSDIPEVTDWSGARRGPWWLGRTFYACPCGAQSETHISKVPVPPAYLPCWGCKAKRGMRPFTHPAVARDRAKGVMADHG